MNILICCMMKNNNNKILTNSYDSVAHVSFVCLVVFNCSIRNVMFEFLLSYL